MIVRSPGWGAVLLGVAVGCSPAPEDETPAATEVAVPAVAAAAVVPIGHSYFPRRADVDYWETVPRTHTDPQLFLQVHPRIETPAEGPWVATFRDANGDVLIRLPGLRVDVATGNFLFLCARNRFAAGDWTIALEVMEGGLVGREPRQMFRFRVE